jgi:hypothetical protein
MECGVIRCGNGPPNIYLTWRSNLNGYELVSLLKKVIGIKNRHLR